MPHDPELLAAVAFQVGSARLAVPAAEVHEFLRAVHVTALPGAPVDVLGIIDLRGQVIPIFELARRLGQPAPSIRVTDQFLICANETLGVFGIRADRVDTLRSIAPAERGEVSQGRDPWVSVIARQPDGLVLICDLAQLLTTSDQALLARALQAAQTE